MVGDRVRLAAGDRVPADIRLTEAKDLFVSQSVITGESGVLEKRAVTLRPGTAKTAADYENVAFLGSTVMGGFDRGANSIAWVLIRFMAVLIPVVFAACGVTKGNWLSAFLFALSVAVRLTPELLPMVVNACLAKGCVAMGKKQTVVKTINAMQGFGSMDLLCVDKTGTLTGDVVVLEYHRNLNAEEDTRVLRHAYLNSYFRTGYKNLMDLAIIRKTEEQEAPTPGCWTCPSVM